MPRSCRPWALRPGDLALEPNSLNTWQNARFTAALLPRTAAYDRLLLVTSGYHLRRSALCFAHFGLIPQLVRADYLTARTLAIPTAENFMLTDLALHEYLGAWRYRL